DEFVDRAWDPPAAHWGGTVLGGRDRVAGGTWLAVRPEQPALAAVLNGRRLLAADDPARHSRGALPLAAVRGQPLPDRAELARFDGFHLVRASPGGVAVVTWDGDGPREQLLPPGDHVITNAGVDVPDD